MVDVFGEIKGEKLCVLTWAAHGQWQGSSFTGLIQGKGAPRWKWRGEREEQCIAESTAVLLAPLFVGKGSRPYPLQYTKSPGHEAGTEAVYIRAV